MTKKRLTICSSTLTLLSGIEDEDKATTPPSKDPAGHFLYRGRSRLHRVAQVQQLKDP